MREELLEKEVLVMYDIREIQNFIFRTNKVKDIVGASRLVDGILEKGLTECRKALGFAGEEMEILMIGGGNAVAIFQKGELAKKMNRMLGRWILEQTYSLQLAIAVVEKTDHYMKDYRRLQEEKTKVKARMPKVHMMGALPIMKGENQTGLPLSETITVNGKKIPVSKEVCLKRKALENDLQKEQEKQIQFDSLVDEKGRDSMLALVHIDGNSMGQKIGQLMEGIDDYQVAKEQMKQISHNINQSFQEAYDFMKQQLLIWAEQTEGESKGRIYLRKIIGAGDDVTFVCQGRLALSLVLAYVKGLEGKVLYEENGIREEEKYGFSVCAGIAYMNSHFPFSEAYKVAEECCHNAKKRAKEEQHKVDGKIGNWVDFQICKSIHTTDFEKDRKKQYQLADGTYLLKRPYYIPFDRPELKRYAEMDQINQADSFALFREIMYGFENGKNGLAQSDLKELRNTYSKGKEAMDTLKTFLESRGKSFPMECFDGKGIANWYDELEMLEWYEDILMRKEDTGCSTK